MRVMPDKQVRPQWISPDKMALASMEPQDAADAVGRCEDKLFHSEARFRSLVSVGGQIVWIADARGEVIEDSVSWRSYTGQRADQLLGRGWQDALHADDRERSALAWHTAVASRSTCQTECRIRKHDGSYGHFAVRGVPVGELGKPREWMCIFTDITQYRVMDRMKDELVASVSHELRTPLASLRGFVELLLHRDYSAEKRKEFLTIVHNESKRLTGLINNFLDLQNLEAGRQTCNLEEVDLGSLIREATSLFIERDKTHWISVDIPDALPGVLADAGRIHQVLANLLSNAFKYSPPGAEVAVKVLERSGEITVSVVDRGIGIAASALPRLFTKFFRADNPTHNRIEGTGLGLVLVKHIIELHNGRVWVESSLGNGSAFFFSLPVSKSEPKHSMRERALIVEPVDILIVEDDVAFCDLLSEHLQTLGLSVATTAYGEAALQMARAALPRLMLIDLKLAGRMCGWELLLTLKSDPKLDAVPALIVTVSEPNVRGLVLGGADYVSKSASHEALLYAIRKRVPIAGKRVLVVDDDSPFRRSIVELLSAEGFIVEEAGDGMEALRRIEERSPDLMLLDLLMPGIDGFEVLERLRSNPQAANLEVLVITAKTLSDDEQLYISRRLATLVGKREADLAYFTKVIEKALGRNLQTTLAARA
jgi:PAS domain S-box-containing protein